MWDNESWKPSTDQLVIPRPFRGSRANIANICPQYACGPGWSTFQNELNKTSVDHIAMSEYTLSHTIIK